MPVNPVAHPPAPAPGPSTSTGRLAAAGQQRVWSLRRRLLAWLLIATLVMGAVALADTWVEAERTAAQLADRVLAGSAMVIAERAALNEAGVLEIAIPYGALEMLSSAAQDRVFYRIDLVSGGAPAISPEPSLDPSSAAVARQAGLVTGYGDLPVAAAQPGGGAAFLDASYRGVPVRIATLARAVSTGIDEVPFTVTMAETTLAREALSRDILLRSALRLLGMIVGAATIVWIAVTLSLRPLARLGEAIASRNTGDLRPVDIAVPAEVQPQMQAVNSLMQRLEGALEGLRNFTGNAAHQLRTPMTVIRTQLTLAARAPDRARAQSAVAQADAALTRAERVLAQLLALARVDAAQGLTQGGRRLGEVMDLVPLVRDLTASHIPAAAEAGVDLGLALGPDAALPLRAQVEPLLFGEALHNLLSNAVLHGGRGTVVTVRLDRRLPPATPDASAQILLEVEDNGPGIPTAQREAALSRFGRADAVSATPGIGLGLPVVKEIVTLFGGSLTLEPSESDHRGDRGLRASIQLPEVQ